MLEIVHRTPDVLAMLTPQDCVRMLRPGETVPKTLDIGFDLLGSLDREWVWVWESEAQIKGVLLAAPCHGVAFIWRLAVEPNQGIAVVKLLRRFLKDIRSRGMKGYITICDQARTNEERLIRVIKKAGGSQFGGGCCVMASGLPRENI